MNFDMGAAWDDAISLLRKNFALIATLVGLFYFLPSLAIGLLYPELADAGMTDVPEGTDPELVFQVMLETMQEQYLKAWPALLVVTLAQYVGVLAVLALFAKNENPTVGEALKTGFRGAPTYIATQLLFGLGAGLIIGLLVGITAPFLPILAAVLGLFGVAIVVFVAFRLILVPAVIAMEGERNPIKAMTRSWNLCKGRTRMIFLFLALLFITIGILSLVASLGFGTVFAALGSTVAQIGGAILSSLINAISGVVFLVVIAAIYRQITGGEKPTDIEAFE